MIKLLIVDDDFPTCDFLKRFLEISGYQVFIANDGESALLTVKEKKPNIVFLDIRMPGVSGIKVLQQIKEIDSNVKVIMMTAVKDEEMIKLTKEYGASDYIVKPFSLEHLEKDVIPKILTQLL